MNYGLPSEAVSPFRLRALTIRGLGSYVHGTRLTIRPLTVLCGTNGSGKSTWIRMLDILKDSYEAGKIPFDFKEDVDSAQYQSTNAHLADPESAEDMPISYGSEYEYGRIGTFGLEFEATRELQLGKKTIESIYSRIGENAFSTFIVKGIVPANTVFNILLTSPQQRSYDYNHGYPLSTGFELRIDDFRFLFEVAPGKNDCLVYCSNSKLPSNKPDTQLIQFCRGIVGKLESAKKNVWCLRTYDANESTVELDFANLVIRRVVQLIGYVLKSYFHVGAIRTTTNVSGASKLNIKNRDKVIQARHVGQDGKHTLFLRGEYLVNTMLNVPSPYSGQTDNYFRYGYADVNRFLRLISSHSNVMLGKHLLGLISEESKNNWFKFLNDNWPLVMKSSKYEIVNFQFWKQLFNNEDLETKIHEWETLDTELFDNLHTQYGCDVLNELLENRNMYSAEFWAELDVEVNFLVERLSELKLADVVRLNRMLLYKKLEPERTYANYGFIFDVFNSEWLKYLVNVRSTFSMSADDTAGNWINKEIKPSGFLLSFTPGQHQDDDNWRERGDLNNFVSEPFDGIGLPAAPPNLSSGFHQVEPIIIQAALMKQFEIFAIENPEVHLHPGLQLRMAEFLISQAKIGKFILVETHSDLVVRRILREIYHEQTKQEMVRIYFSTLKRTPNSHIIYSDLEPISLNDRGQVDNWPEGFMDDDIRESRLLMQSIYGQKETEDDENE